MELVVPFRYYMGLGIRLSCFTNPLLFCGERKGKQVKELNPYLLTAERSPKRGRGLCSLCSVLLFLQDLSPDLYPRPVQVLFAKSYFHMESTICVFF